MDESRIRQIMKEEIANYQTTFASISVTPHIHNGSDSPQIRASNLIPYDFIDDFTQRGASTLPPEGYDGQIYYNKDIGYTYIYLKGQWNYIDVISSGLQAYISSPQTVASGTPTQIVFDDYIYDPANEFDPLTGEFRVNTGFYIVHARVTFDSSIAAGAPIEISIWNTGNNPLAIAYIPDSTDTISADVTFMGKLSSLSLSVQVLQTSGVTKNILINSENSSFYIKKFAVESLT